MRKGDASKTTGTTVQFWPSKEIFETTDFSFEVLSTRFREMAFLNKGLILTLTDMRAFSTFKIFPRIGRTAWLRESRPPFVEPPAESPSTIYS